MKIPVISIDGTPYEIGYKHGKETREAIQRNFRFYLHLMNHYSSVEYDQVITDTRKFIPYIENIDSELIEELEGVAKGSGMRFEEILALNSRYELSFAYTSAASNKITSSGCTAFALNPEVTQNQHTLAGQNWDYRPGVENSCVILRIKQKRKPDIIMHTEAGIIGHKAGLNSAGLGVFGNYIRCEKDTFQTGLPACIKMRIILNSVNLTDCLKILMNYEGPNSFNTIIVHRDGEAIDVECTPDDTFFLYPKQGILVHTNHFLSSSLRVKDTGKNLFPDTVVRSHRAFRLFRDKRKDLNLANVKDILSDHFDHPNSICRHRDELLHPNEQWETLASIIIDLTEGKMYYTKGPPCSSSYEGIGF
jgi:isopenicillin-N N-acyltransferase-like protein